MVDIVFLKRNFANVYNGITEYEKNGINIMKVKRGLKKRNGKSGGKKNL